MCFAKCSGAPPDGVTLKHNSPFQYTRKKTALQRSSGQLRPLSVPNPTVTIGCHREAEDAFRPLGGSPLHSCGGNKNPGSGAALHRRILFGRHRQGRAPIECEPFPRAKPRFAGIDSDGNGWFSRRDLKHHSLAVSSAHRRDAKVIALAIGSQPVTRRVAVAAAPEAM